MKNVIHTDTQIHTDNILPIYRNENKMGFSPILANIQVCNWAISLFNPLGSRTPK